MKTMIAATGVTDVGEKEGVARNRASNAKKHLTSHLTLCNKASAPCLSFLMYKMGIIKGYSACNSPVAA